VWWKTLTKSSQESGGAWSSVYLAGRMSRLNWTSCDCAANSKPNSYPKSSEWWWCMVRMVTCFRLRRLCVRWGPSPLPPQGGATPSPIFSPFLLWPNGCMHQNATWYDTVGWVTNGPQETHATYPQEFWNKWKRQTEVELACSLPSNRHHRSNGDCLEGKRKTIRSVLCNIVCNNSAQCNGAMHTHMNRPNSSLDWVFSHWAHFTVLRFICVLCILYACVAL